MPYFNQFHNDQTRALARLIAERMAHPEKASAIDDEIWSTFGETHAVMFTDLSGFSRGVEKFGIIHFLQIIYESEVMFAHIIGEHGGHIIKSEADSLLVIFPDVKKAVTCGNAMQNECARRNETKTPEEKILLCLGIGFGKILNLGLADVYGAEVNAASKLGEDIARAGEILITDNVALELAKLGNYHWEAIAETPPGAKAAYKLLASPA
jgi:class 3 adenylate cyclase